MKVYKDKKHTEYDVSMSEERRIYTYEECIRNDFKLNERLILFCVFERFFYIYRRVSLRSTISF